MSKNQSCNEFGLQLSKIWPGHKILGVTGSYHAWVKVVTMIFEVGNSNIDLPRLLKLFEYN